MVPPAAELTLNPNFIHEDVSLSMGQNHTCLLDSSGNVSCSSFNSEMQSNILQVSAGTRYTCVLKTDSTVECNGINDAGQLNVPP